MDLSKVPFEELRKEYKKRQDESNKILDSLTSRIYAGRKLLEESLGGREYTDRWTYYEANFFRNPKVVDYLYYRESGYETYEEHHQIPIDVFDTDESMQSYFKDKISEGVKLRAEIKRKKAIDTAKEAIRKAKEEYDKVLLQYAPGSEGEESTS